MQISTTPATSHESSRASLEAIDALARDVRDVFDRGTTRPLAWRKAQLDGLERLIAECEGELAAALEADLGRHPIETFTGEIAITLSEIRHLRKHMREWSKEERVPSPMHLAPSKASIVREPLGVVLVIAPWNYPFMLAITPLVGAIAAGNAVVVKPSEVAPATSAVLAKLLPRYVDKTAIRVVEGGVAETTRLLDQRWDHIFYTGNGAVARVVMTAAAKHLTPVTLELGGKSPTYIDASANLDVAARRVALGKFFNAGQTCVAPDYVLVHESVHDAFVAKLRETLVEFYGSDPKASPDFARVINERHHRRLTSLLPGSGEVVAGGVADEATRYLAPTVLTGVSADSPVMADEIFGPILPILRTKGVDDAIRFINARPKPLALYVFAEDDAVSEAIIARTSAGGVCVNHVVLHVAVPDLPFGGVGPSGMGAYHGRDSFDTFSHRKAVLRKPTFLDPKLPYPPYTPFKQGVIRKVL